MSDLISRKYIIQAHKEYCEKHPNANWYKWSLSIMQTAPSVEPKIVRCKDCEFFEFNHFDYVDGFPLITAHEICTKWGDGCKTDADGFCFLAERRKDDRRLLLMPKQRKGENHE